jgi:hypothetical protein
MAQLHDYFKSIMHVFHRQQWNLANFDFNGVIVMDKEVIRIYYIHLTCHLVCKYARFYFNRRICFWHENGIKQVREKRDKIQVKHIQFYHQRIFISKRR